ncbi:MAG: hypothetical protein IJ741_11180, partial [Schwartzia sp.]|nr:hypothetical protein [Schwartzia sp. (in: firmicutes)]
METKCFAFVHRCVSHLIRQPSADTFPSSLQIKSQERKAKNFKKFQCEMSTANKPPPKRRL